MIEPMLASAERNGPALASLAGTHGFDTKLDGVRALIYWDGARVEIRNRNNVNITDRWPDVVAAFPNVGGPLILDGEIIAVDLSFESTQLRDRQVKAASIARMAAQIPAKFIAFDLLQLSDVAYLNRAWQDRRAALDALCRVHGIETTPWSKDPALYDLIRARGMEGVIAKRFTSRYQPGRRSPDWIKFKCVHRVSCVPVGYEPGTGGRAHFGAMHLAMIGDSGPVVVGRVGTGFTARDIDDLKARLDKRELFVVEIECLNVTKSGQLRFPVFKGIRSDLTPADATTVQLAALPTC